MSSRDDILVQLRQSTSEEEAYPNLNQSWTTYPDQIVKFQESVAGVGGHAVRLDSGADLTETITRMEVYQATKKVASCSTHTRIENVSLDNISDPHALEDLDLFIADGSIGVAENGAVWLTDEKIPHRVALFITQHLILTVESRCIVHNMHEAYQQIATVRPGFGIFISGPSKTADIEQSLVTGAHGARSLTVFILD